MTDAPERIWAWDDENCTPNNPHNKFTTEYIRADLCKPEAQGWQPIETAPKDGTRVLAYWPDYSCQVESWFGPWLGEMVWQSAFEWADGHNNPTHWMQLPDPPQP